MLVDRKGRKFLLVLGTSGIIVSIVSVGILFLRTENASVDAVICCKLWSSPIKN